MMVFLKRILLISIFFYSVLAQASQSSCDAGYEQLRNKEYSSSVEHLTQCLNSLFAQKNKDFNKIVWGYYLITNAYYMLDDYSAAYDNAQNVDAYTMFDNPLGSKERAFLKHIYADMQPEYRTDLESVVQINFALSVNDNCGASNRRDYTASEGSRLESCRDRKNHKNIPNFYDAGTESMSKACEILLLKYKGCKILYCVNGSYQLTSSRFASGSKKIICEKKEIDYYSASKEDQKAAIEDEFLGPLGYDLASEKKRALPAINNPFIQD